MKRLFFLAALVFALLACEQEPSTIGPVPLTADVVTTSEAVGSGEKYHRPEKYYNGKLCRTIQHSTLHYKNHQTAIDEGFEPCKVCEPDKTIKVDD